MTVVKNWCNIKEAAAYLGVSTSKAYQLVKEGVLPAYKYTSNSDMRFEQSDLDKLIEKSKINGDALNDTIN